MQIRGITAADYAGWRSLWDGYLAFYGVEIPEPVTDSTFQRLVSDGAGLQGLIVLEQDEPVGFAHLILHLCTWDLRPSCYLEDLFVASTHRGQGIGRALLDWIVASAEETGIGRLYWHTAEDNARARQLYDHYSRADGFVRYRLAIVGQDAN